MLMINRREVYCLQLLLLLGTHLVLSSSASIPTTVPDDFLYHNFLQRSESKEVKGGGEKLHVDSAQSLVTADRDGNSTLPCTFWYEPAFGSPREVRVKWSWLPPTGEVEMDVLVAIGSRSRTLGEFRGRVHLRQDFPGDAALVMTDLRLNDTGRYRCEVVDGLEDKSTSVFLDLYGVVFPYQHPRGRYQLSFLGAQQACEEQDATVATFAQLHQSWKEGMNWCNAGWLADGTVQYPITQPRVTCGGHSRGPGVRSYGSRHRHLHRYDVFCFSSSLRGKVFYLQPSHKMTLPEAQLTCQESGAEIAKVGQLYSAWRFAGLDHCEAGWLADGSVRYAISRPRTNCGPPEPGVRSFGFPPPQQKHGVYCYKPDIDRE
ncbi:hyaluronan and proteoglycan link protein 3-like [Nelusetta ayraudi]|uniref:hyaluronan and proteoglycan link protein 3-like n=1 Tax=Nelusetta ayraudi TaxID=303726 RepID=UPI003F70BFB9